MYLRCSNKIAWYPSSRCLSNSTFAPQNYHVSTIAARDAAQSRLGLAAAAVRRKGPRRAEPGERRRQRRESLLSQEDQRQLAPREGEREAAAAQAGQAGPGGRERLREMNRSCSRAWLDRGTDSPILLAVCVKCAIKIIASIKAALIHNVAHKLPASAR